MKLLQQLPNLKALVVCGEMLYMHTMNTLPIDLVSHWHIQGLPTAWSRANNINHPPSFAFSLKEILLSQDMLYLLFDTLYMIRIDHLVVIPRGLSYMKKRNQSTLTTFYSEEDSVTHNDRLAEQVFKYLKGKCMEDRQDRPDGQTGTRKLDIKSVTCAIDLSREERQLFESFIPNFSSCTKNHIYYNMTPDVEKYWE